MRTRTFLDAFKKPVILLMTMMVLSFSLGSLINFHLNRIYGNPLASDLLFVKKDEKIIKTVKSPVVSAFAGLITENTVVTEPSVPEFEINFHDLTDGLPDECNPLNTLLRAPPVL